MKKSLTLMPDDNGELQLQHGQDPFEDSRNCIEFWRYVVDHADQI